jgi:hypothetical protein
VATVVTGALWLAVPESPEFSVFLFVLSLLGGSALAASGLWQHAAGPKSRVFVLVLLAVLSGGAVGANTLGVLLAGSAPELITGLAAVRVAHWAGLVVAGALYLLTLGQGLGALRDRDRALDSEGG